MSRFTLRNQFFGLVLLAIAILAVACNGQYFKATEHYSGQIEEALESIKAPAFYNVFVTPKGQDIFQLRYFMYNREAGKVVGVTVGHGASPVAGYHVVWSLCVSFVLSLVPVLVSGGGRLTGGRGLSGGAVLSGLDKFAPY